MTLPASLLAAVESHACFSGCYSHESPVVLCVDPAQPPVVSLQASCKDCLMFHVGALSGLLPVGTSQYTLAQELAAHMRGVRGYRWALSGYHTASPGFWLSAAYLGDGLFLVDGSRNHGITHDIDLLVQAFKASLVQPDDPGMLDPALYSQSVVHLSCAPALGPVRVKQDILSSPQCSVAPKHGFRRVAIVEFLPLTAGAAVGLAASTPAPAASIPSAAVAPVPAALAALAAPAAPAAPAASAEPPVKSAPQRGELCSACGAEFRERPLFTGTYVGCLC